MEKLTHELKVLIESLACLEHKQRPIITIDEDDVKLKCCCPKFKVQCFHLIRKISSLSFPDADKNPSNSVRPK